MHSRDLSVTRPTRDHLTCHTQRKLWLYLPRGPTLCRVSNLLTTCWFSKISQGNLSPLVPNPQLIFIAAVFYGVGVSSPLHPVVEMHDPFPISPIPWLSKAVEPLARFFNLPTLPLHVHQVLISFVFYHWVNVWFAPRISSYLFPQKYNALSAEKKLNWNVHVVSLAQSTTINLLALYVMLYDEERKNMTAQERVFGYTGGAGMIQGLAAGYFLWDLFVTVQHVKMFGIGMLAHAMSAFLVFSFGFVSFLILLSHVSTTNTNTLCRDHSSTIMAALSSSTNYHLPSSTFTGSLISWV